MPAQWVTETLRKYIVVKAGTKTSSIEIGVFNPDAQVAADIANAISSEYRHKRLQKMSEDRETMIAEVKDQTVAHRMRAYAARYCLSISACPVNITRPAQPAPMAAWPDPDRIRTVVNVVGGSFGAIGVFLILVGAFVPLRMFPRAEDQH